MPPIRLLLALPVVAAIAWGVRGWVAGEAPASTVEPLGRPAASLAIPVTLESATPAASDPGAEAVAAFVRHLDAAAAQAGDLVALGETKSRNLIAITGQQRRMDDLLDETDVFLASAALPEDAVPAVAAYRDGAAAVRAAMADAQAGFVRFDWERVRRATGEMVEGEAALARAAGLLE